MVVARLDLGYFFPFRSRGLYWSLLFQSYLAGSSSIQLGDSQRLSLLNVTVVC